MNIGTLIRFRSPRLDERGTAMMEYALLASGIAVVAIAAVSYLGKNTAQTFAEASDGFTAAGMILPGNDGAGDDQDGFPGI